MSSLYRSAPVATGPADQFLNAAALIETDLDPEPLLDLLQSIENQCGRTRERRWGPRTLDLDLIFFGNAIYESPRLIVPHPAAWFRRFVLDPVVELMPGYVHPVKRVSLDTLWQRLLPRPLTFALAGGPDRQTALEGACAEATVEYRFVLWPECETDSAANCEPTFIVWCGDEYSVGTSGEDPRYLALPPVPRIDATRSKLPVTEFVQYLVQAALGHVERVALPREWRTGGTPRPKQRGEPLTGS